MPQSPPGVEHLEQQVRAACNELGRRWRSGETCLAEEYLQRIPDIAAHADLALEVLYTEFVVRDELHRQLPEAEWLARFPQWRQDLEQLFEVHQQICADDADRSTPRSERSAMDTAVSANDVAPAAATGVLVGNYELLGEIGRGGMGVVYRARQSNLNREVALKMILSGAYASPRELARFQTEARSAAGLQHPNIVQIYEVGTHDGRPFLSMELVDGGSLEGQLKRAPWAPRDAATLLETLARAIHFAHERGVVHRDLKPGNVLLTLQGLPKVADFGLAKQVLEGPTDQTRTGSVLGTPTYMAPEQARGESASVGPATDVYALGAILYEVLTGGPPLVGDTPLETVRLVVHEEPLPPTRRRPQVPRDLETICLKCLEKDPHRRYASAGKLAEDLRRFLQGEPIRARAAGPTERLWKWARRRPALATLLVLLAVGFLTVSALWATSEHHRRHAEAAAAKADQLRIRAEAEQQLAERSLYFHRVGQAQGAWQAYQVGRAEELLEECPPELRDWEWSYLESLCHADVHTLRGHTDVAWSLAYSPDGRMLASGSGQWGWTRPGEIILWDAATGASRAVLHGHRGPVMGLAFSPDSQKLASASFSWEAGGPGGVKIWSSTGQELRTIPSPGDNAFAVAFSPDGRELATAGSDGRVRLWDVAEGTLRGTCQNHKNLVFDVKYSPDGERVASVGRDGSVRIWERSSGTEERVVSGYADLRRLAYSPDGRYLAFTSYSGDLRIWDVSEPPERVQRYSYSQGTILSLDFSPEGRRLALSGRDGSVVLVDTASGRELKRLHTHNGVVRDLVFSPDGRILATAGMDRLVKTWDVRTDLSDDAVNMNSHAKCGAFPRIALTPAGRCLLLPNGFSRGWPGAGEKTLLVWDCEQGKVLRTLRGHTGWLTGVAVTPDGTRYVTASEDRTARLWDANTGAELHRLTGHSASVTGVAVDSRGARVATASADGTVRLWAAGSGQPQRVLRGHDEGVTCVAFSPDGRRLASAGKDQTVRLWNPEAGTEVQILRGHTAAVTALAYSHDGKWLTSASEDTTVRLWDAATGKPLHVLRGHSGTVMDVAFSHDDRRLGSGSTDWTVKLWDPFSGEEALTLHSPSAVLCLAFHPDGKRLVSVDGWNLRWWDAEIRSRSPRAAAAFDAANVAWHERELRKCLADKRYQAAIFHFRRLLAAQPGCDQKYTQQADKLADAGDLEGAAAVLDMIFECEGISPLQIYRHALLELHLGHAEEYRRACQRLLGRLTDKSPPSELYLAVWHSALAPGAAEPAQLLALIERAAATATPSEQLQVLQTWGLALFRAGKLAEARQKMQQALALQGGETIENLLLMALIEAGLEHFTPAQQCLDKAAAMRATATAAKPAKATPAAGWSEQVLWTILADEAKSVVSSKASGAK